MSAAHTPGPWILMTVPTSVGSCHKIGPFPNGERVSTFACVYADGHRIGVDDANPAAVELAANARLIAAAPELLEALRECVDAMWQVDSHSVVFDSTVLFGPSYDFSGIDGPRREEFLAEHCCIVWPSGGIGASKWSAYCTFDGSLWFERFATATEAKEQCMRMLDKVMPAHPAMKARAAIAKATGGAQ